MKCLTGSVFLFSRVLGKKFGYWDRTHGFWENFEGKQFNHFQHWHHHIHFYETVIGTSLLCQRPVPSLSVYSPVPCHFLSDPSPIIAYSCQWLTDWLTPAIWLESSTWNKVRVLEKKVGDGQVPGSCRGLIGCDFQSKVRGGKMTFKGRSFFSSEYEYIPTTNTVSVIAINSQSLSSPLKPSYHLVIT